MRRAEAYPIRPAAGDWLNDAGCRDIPTDVFFVTVGKNANTAKEVCGHCPVRTECLTHAVENHEEHGVWGGLSPWERRHLATRQPRRKPVAQCGTDAGYYRHLRQLREPACEACLEAHRVAQRVRRPA